MVRRFDAGVRAFARTRSTKRSVTVPSISMPIAISESPWLAWTSPTITMAPGRNTGM